MAAILVSVRVVGGGATVAREPVRVPLIHAHIPQIPHGITSFCGGISLSGDAAARDLHARFAKNHTLSRYPCTVLAEGSTHHASWVHEWQVIPGNGPR